MKKKSYGLSLAELLIVLSVLSIAASLAGPALDRQVENQRRVQTLNQMLGILGYTRSSAVYERSATILCPGSSDCAGITHWSGDLLIFHDHNGNARRDADEPILRHERLPDGYSWRWSSFRGLDHIVFQPDGTARAANGTLTLCRNGQPQHQVILNVAGRVRHQAPAAGARCG